MTFCLQFGLPTHINYEEQCLCMYEAIRHVNRGVMKSTRMCTCLRWPSLDCFEKLICVELGNYKLIFTTESFRLCSETNISISVHPNVSPLTKKSCLEQSLIHQAGRMEIPSLSVKLRRRKQRGEKSVEKRLLRCLQIELWRSQSHVPLPLSRQH